MKKKNVFEALITAKMAEPIKLRYSTIASYKLIYIKIILNEGLIPKELFEDDVVIASSSFSGSIIF